ncbi:MAG: glycosyltransferase family 39 protein [Bacteroidales bacterium]|nr:glycosyltransferase family 39 protein [Bacteroidales bacterium]
MNKRENRVLLLLFSVLYLYMVLRAIYVPLLHDEIATFFRYVHIGRFIPYYSEWSTNNHILNSLLTFGSYKLFGYSAFAQRLPNLLFVPVYFYFIYKFCTLVNNRILAWGFVLLTVCTHNYLEFFFISRGYGISLAMLAASIWFTMEAIKSKRSKYYALALTTMLFSVSAILIMVNSYILIILILLVNTFQNLKISLKTTTIQIGYIVFLGVIPVILTIVYLFDLSAIGRLDYGGSESFWSNSIKTLTEFLASPFDHVLNIYILILLAALIVSFVLIVKQELAKNKSIILLNPNVVFFYLLTGNIFGFFIEHTFFEILYPEYRTAIQFILLFAGSLVFIFDQVTIQSKKYLVLLLVPVLFFPAQFISNANLSWSSIENHAIPERFYTYIASKKTDDRIPTVQGHRNRIMRWNWLNFTGKKELPCIHTSNYPSLTGDFQIVFPHENPEWQRYYDSVDMDIHSGIYLLERKQKLSRELILSTREVSTDGIISNEFFEIYSASIDTLKGYDLYVEFNLQLTSLKNPFHTWIVATVFDENRNQVRYECVPLDWFRSEWYADATFKNGLTIHNLPAEGKNLVIYCWNMFESEFEIKKFELEIFRIDTKSQELRTKNQEPKPVAKSLETYVH